MEEVKFSIVIAAKNEEDNIALLLYALEQLEYPEELYEVIIVDDNSDDDTYKVASALSKGKENYTVIKSGDKPYPAKKGALAVGIRHAKHPYIIITDADCAPRPGWLSIFAGKFNKGTDIAFGISPYIQQDIFVNKIACFENLRAHMLTFTFAEWGIPYSAAARNFGFRKESFEKLGGYQNTTETLSGDDDLLIREAVKNNMQVETVTNPDAFVYSKTKQTWKEYLKQKARHVSTSPHYLLKHKVLLGLWHILNIIAVVMLPLGFVNPLLAIPFFVKMFFDVVSVQSSQKKYGYCFGFIEIIPLQVTYELLHIIHFVNSFFAKNKWK